MVRLRESALDEENILAVIRKGDIKNRETLG